MLGEALRLIRVYHDLKQKQVAERLDISTSYLSEIEKGHKTPTLEVIQRYSDVFGLPVSSIMFFAESVEGGGSADRARTFVAGKMVGLMQFLEARSDRAYAE
ncbi:helix-turn-helix domain-containing protein [Tsuneonella sp. YG55]|jgi:transcriptional regulator with XRE-family HTH domain|uniref:Helix-turn-helix domain-containing protein n=1 Tax=Tsuneonella litorea TaxID=2976475 RepID=A0A9X2W3S1_9SPHN|nr:helix-turn-helix transcriptional regulator [Tsuneonella litorea]MCT2560054.1 helix-turn-helix domain-containing protein [Tsuneonella litorea]